MLDGLIVICAIAVLFLVLAAWDAYEERAWRRHLARRQEAIHARPHMPSGVRVIPRGDLYDQDRVS